EIAAREARIDVLRDGADDLHLGLTRGAGLLDPRQGLVRDGLPAKAEVLGHVADRRPFEAASGVVPPEPFTSRVIAPVEAAPRVVGQVDPADEGDSVVDDDELFVMAVHRALPRVQRAADARAACECVAKLPALCSIRVEERKWRAGPAEHADVDTLRKAPEELAEAGPIGP